MTEAAGLRDDIIHKLYVELAKFPSVATRNDHYLALSFAIRDLPAVGHGLRYEFGIFDQDIRDGWQVERTDRWLRNGNPWEVRRYEIEHKVKLGGHTEHTTDAHGTLRVRWVPERVVKGVPY